ncbi:MAG: hypothetical protein IJO22_03560 [Oscillospiraceae bacterium]|nr:hypothetical protein [Oscillospiraceae bacterium]
MKNDDIFLAIGKIDDEIIEKSEREIRRGLGKKTAALIAAALIFMLSVTAVAAAKFFNTVNEGEIVFMEALGGYSGDHYNIRFNIDVAEDSDRFLHDYYVPAYLEENENWTDSDGEAGETYNIMCYDNYEENLYAIFFQYPAWNYDNGASIGYGVPAGTEVSEGVFEIDGEELFCVEFLPCDDGFRGDPFGTKVIFWSDGYNMFVLETRLGMDEETVREIIRSVQKVEDISEYVKYEEMPD